MKLRSLLVALVCLCAAAVAHAQSVTLNCGANTGKPATGAPIEIGAIVSKTGPSDFSSSARAAEAYFKCVNANGGIHGRPIHYDIADDEWSPEQAAELATKLARDVKVVAMIGNASFVDCASNSKFYESENLAVISGVGVPRDCFYARNIAMANQGPRLSNVGAVTYMKKAFDVKRVVCLGYNIPGVGDWSCGGIAQWGKLHGVAVKTILVDPANLDPTSVLLQASSFNPDLIHVNYNKEEATTLFAAAEQQDMGARYKWSAPSSLYNSDFPKAIGSYWDGRIFVYLELEPLDKKSPDMQNWLAVMNKYASRSAPRDTFAQAGYLSARIATAALLTLDATNINRNSVSAALRKIRGFHSDMMCGVWYYGPGERHNPNHAGSIAVLAHGGFTLKESCIEADDPDLASIRKLETDLKLTQ